jgi:hypothetical protein
VTDPTARRSRIRNAVPRQSIERDYGDPHTEVSRLEPRVVADTADYIARMSAELAALAQSCHLDLLAYLLDMARIQASVHVQRNDLMPIHALSQVAHLSHDVPDKDNSVA